MHACRHLAHVTVSVSHPPTHPPPHQPRLNAPPTPPPHQPRLKGRLLGPKMTVDAEAHAPTNLGGARVGGGVGVGWVGGWVGGGGVTH